MEFKRIISSIIILSFVVGCTNQSYQTKLPISKDTANELEKRNTLFVFVGELIEFKDILDTAPRFDHGITSKYKVIQPIYGDYSKDTIEFEAYDHYGRPPYLDDKHVMLFLSEENGKYYQEKYQYFPVFKTRNNRWAGAYPFFDYSRFDSGNCPIKPEKINFVDKVSFPYSKEIASSYKEGFYFPSPYYRIEDGRAIAIYGNYIEDLFRIKKEGVLKARGLF